MAISIPVHPSFRRSIPALVGCVGLAVCGTESTGPGEDPGADFGDGLETVACTGLSLSAASGVPLDVVDAGTVPSTLEPPLAARVLASDGTTMGYAWFEVDEAGRVELVTPLHPSGSLEGGAVRIRATDGRVACAPWDFTIEALPDAEGELAAVVDGFQEVLGAQAAVLGATTEELQTTPFGDLPDVLLPLAFIQWVLDHPDNDASLRAIADGSGSEDVPIERLEALLARTGLREALSDPPAPAAQRVSAAPMRAVEPESCTPDGIGEDTQMLSDCMVLVREIRELVGEIVESRGEALGAAFLAEWAAPEVAAGAVRTVLATLGWVAIQQELASYAALPGFLDVPVIEADPDRYMEDDSTTGTWSASVTARSAGWDDGVASLESLFRGVGWDALAEAGALPQGADFAQEVSRLLHDAVGDFLGTEEIPPRVFGPVPVDDETWSDVAYFGPSVEQADSHTSYRPVAVGETVLSIGIPAEGDESLFGGVRSLASVNLRVDSMIIRIEPSETVMPPGTIDTFRVTVENAVTPAPLIAGGEGGGRFLEWIVSGENTRDLVYEAPTNPTASTLITVRDDSQEGARANGPLRADTALVWFAFVRITTDLACVELGAEPIQIETERPDGIGPLTFGASLGTINETGVYTPPSYSGVDTITVAAELDPRIRDFIVFRVGGCACQATLTIDGILAATSSVSFTLTQDLSAVGAVAWRGGTFEQATFGFGPDPRTPESVPIGSTGPFVGGTSGTALDMQFLNPDDPDDPAVDPLSVTINENTGSLLSGLFAGSVVIPSNDPEPQIAQILFEFYIEADPTLSSDDVKVCEVPTGG
jgi:hypothetical protein